MPEDRAFDCTAFYWVVGDLATGAEISSTYLYTECGGDGSVNPYDSDGGGSGGETQSEKNFDPNDYYFQQRNASVVSSMKCL